MLSSVCGLVRSNVSRAPGFGLLVGVQFRFGAQFSPIDFACVMWCVFFCCAGLCSFEHSRFGMRELLKRYVICWYIDCSMSILEFGRKRAGRAYSRATRKCYTYVCKLIHKSFITGAWKFEKKCIFQWKWNIQHFGGVQICLSCDSDILWPIFPITILGFS